MEPFTQQDRPEKVKDVYRALKREHPKMSCELKARIAAKFGKHGVQHPGPPYAAPLSKGADDPRGKDVFPELIVEYASKAAREYCAEKTNLNASLAKHADGMNDQQLATACQLANRFTHLKLRKEGETTTEFPVADPAVIRHGAMTKQADLAVAGTLQDAEVVLPVYTARRQVALSGPVWGEKKADGLWAQGELEKRRPEITEEFYASCRQLSGDIAQLVKHAEVSPGEILAAALRADEGKPLPLCLAICCRMFTSDEYTDMPKYASMTPETSHPVFRNMQRLHVVVQDYLKVCSDPEKFSQGVWACLPKEAAGGLMGIPGQIGKKLSGIPGVGKLLGRAFGLINPAFFAWQVGEGALKGARVAGMGRAAALTRGLA